MNQTSEQDGAATTVEISRLADHLFRHEAGKLISVLTGIFGINRLQLAEDVVQESLVRALRTWPYAGIPKNPAAWLTQTAKNLALDLIRREKLISRQGTADHCVHGAMAVRFRDGRIAHVRKRNQGRPAAADVRVLPSGFVGRRPIGARSQDPVRVQRDRNRERISHNRSGDCQTFDAGQAKDPRSSTFRLRYRPATELSRRLDGVLQTLYLLFNEGYKASSGDDLIKEDLCQEAIRLGALLAEHPAGINLAPTRWSRSCCSTPRAFPARTDSEGNILRLKSRIVRLGIRP